MREDDAGGAAVIVTCPFEGANLVFARIDEMLPRDKPCFTTALGPHGGSFIRTGDGDRRMTSYEVDRLIEEHLQPTYDLDIVPDATTDDLDPQLVAGLLARVREQHPRVFADRDGIDVLLDLQVLRHDDSDESEVGGILRPTLAGLLALGRYPQKFYPRLGISIAVFPGTSRDDVFRGDERLVASKSVVGSIPVMIDDAVDSLMRWIGAKKPTIRRSCCARRLRTRSPTVIIRPMRAARRCISACSPIASRSPIRVACTAW